MTTATETHKIHWFVYAGSERLPRTSKMRGTWGYDVECSCGWRTRTGGAVERHIRDEIWLHKNFPGSES
jgi:hypothetical protein